MKKNQTIADLQMAATKKICSGDLTVEQLQNFIDEQILSPKRIIRSFDVCADGKVQKHVSTEKEAIEYACRCEDFDELVKQMASSREVYLDQVKKAENARNVKKEKMQAALEARAAQEAQVEG